CALSQTVCNRKSEISALVEKKTGLDGKRTLIHAGLCAWCNAGSIFAQDISIKLAIRASKSKLGVFSEFYVGVGSSAFSDYLVPCLRQNARCRFFTNGSNRKACASIATPSPIR